jgi:hypothetical protein
MWPTAAGVRPPRAAPSGGWMPGYRLDPHRLGPAFDALETRVADGRLGAAGLVVGTSAGPARAAPFGDSEASKSAIAAVHGALVAA